MRAIFISYRRDDSEGEAGRLFDDLVGEFGDNSVFMDVAAIEVGRDFRKAIDESVSTCGVLLAVIGKDWLDTKNEAGQRRLDDPADFVRLETASALKRDIPVIPVLVRGAKMPRPEQLPEDLKELAYRNGVELTHARWNSDLHLLIKALRRIVEPPEKEQDSVSNPPAVGARVEMSPSPSRKVDETRRPQPPAVPDRKSRSAVFTFLAIAVLLAAGAAYRFWPTQATVPDLTGSTLSEATKKLEAAHLAVGRTTYQQDASTAPGAVLTQSPSPYTRMKSSTPVDLVMAQRPASAEIPALTGKSLDPAKRKPAPPTVRVPNLVGLSLDQARNQIQANGLDLGSTTLQSKAGVSPGTVLSQSPNPGLQVQKSSSVDIIVSREEVVQILPLTVFASCNPQAIFSGQTSAITVLVRRPDGTVIPDASVSIGAGGGTFAGTGDSTVAGNTDNNGIYRANWTAPLNVAKGYGMGVAVKKKGFQDWNGQVVIQTNQSPREAPAAPAAKAAILPQITKGFTLNEVFGAREVVPFRINQPGKIVLEAAWEGQTPLALILNGPGKTGAYDRRDGVSPLRVEYQVTTEDFAKGEDWRASIVNFSKAGPVSGALRIIPPR